MFEMALLRTPRLQLVPCAADALTLLIADPATFERTFGLRLIEDYLEFPGALEYALEQMQQRVEERMWWSPMLLVHQVDRAVIGLGGYKGPPDDKGVVEIGYGVAPSYRRQGYAAEAARALVTHAFTSPLVRLVRAHTLPEVNPSNSVLKKCGFQNTGEIFDPGDGKIWRWELTRDPVQPATQ